MRACPKASRLLLLTLSCCAAACGSTENAGSVQSVFVVPESLDQLSEAAFFDQPWPSDLRLQNGSPRLTGYYNPNALPILSEYVTAMEGKLDGFSPSGAGYLRFTGPLDPSSLPSPSEALNPVATVQLVDVDPASPERGQRRLVSLSFRETEGVYWRENTLAFMPTLGFPLLPATRYALVVTDRVRAAGGGTVTPGPGIAQALGLEPYAAAAAELAAAGIPRERIAHLAVFTTADPTAELFAVRDVVRSEIPPPTANPREWQVVNEGSVMAEYFGVYGPSPNFQAGDLPFRTFGTGGSFNVVNGKPTVVDMFDLRFSLVVPNSPACPMPASGYPIVLYAHGSGGNYRSYVWDGTAKALAQRCLASMGIDQIFHGTRPGSPENPSDVLLLFFNFQNIEAGRTNNRQSAIDEVQRARLFTESKMTIPADVSVTNSEVRFDPNKVMFFGHSQGGLNGPLFIAADDAVRGAVLSGSSAVMSITLLEKTQPDPSVAAIVQSVFLGLNAEQAAELNVFHPAMSLAQTIVDVTDPLNYARFAASQPRAGSASKSVYMTEGINPDGIGDSYSPPHGIEAHAIAMGLPLQTPFQSVIEELQWGGPQPVQIPPGGLAGNLAGGAASGVLAQWAVPVGSDGHFVVFDVPQATAQAAEFLKNLAADPKGNVPPP